MKRLLTILPILILVVLGGLVVAPSFIDWSSYKTQIQEQIKEQADLDVSLDGSLSLSFMPSPRLIAENISVGAPIKGQYDSFLTLKRAEVGLDVMPLLSGQVVVNAFSLIEPQIFLEKGQDGKITALTPKIETLMSSGQAGGQTDQASSLPMISFEKIHIQDGRFALYDHATKQETLLENITGNLKMASLLGPYDAKVSLVHQGRIIEIKAEAEKYDPNAKILSTKLNTVLQPGNINLSYAGALGLSEDFSAQGQIEMTVEDLGKTLLANGIIDNAAAAQGAFHAKGFLNANTKQLEINDFEFALEEQKIAGQLRFDYEPFTVGASLKTLQDIDIQKFFTAYPNLKKGAFDFVAEGNQESVRVSKATLRINDEPYEIEGSYAFKNKTGRPVFNIKLSGNSFDSALFKSSGEKKKSIDKTDGKNNSLTQNTYVSLPFDLGFSLALKKANLEEISLSNVQAEGVLSQKQLKLDTLSFQASGDANASISGQIDDCNALSGISLSGSLVVKDIRKFASAVKLNVAQLPEAINQGTIKFKATGDQSTLNTTANITAANGEVIASGVLQNPMQAPTIDGLTLQIKHRSMDEAMRLFSGSKDKNAQFSKPLDFYAKVQQAQNGAYQISGIKADLSGIKMQGNVNVVFEDDKPSLVGDLSFGEINLGSSQSAKVSDSGQSKKGNSQAAPTSRWSKEPIDLSFLSTFHADLKISAKRFTQGAWVINDMKSQIEIKDGSLSVQDLSGSVFGGKLALSSTVKTVPQPRQPIHATVQASLENIEIGSAMRALAGSELVKISGRTSSEVSLKTSGLSMAALVYDLSGQGTVQGADIVLDDVDVEQFAIALSEESKPGDTVLGVWKGASKGGSTAFNTLNGSFTITEGIVNIQKMDLDGERASIFTTGKVDLPNWTLATKHKLTAKTRPDVPPFDMSFSGSLDNPAQTFGQGALQDYLQRKAQRKINKYVGEKIGEKLGIPLGGGVEEISPADGQETPSEPQQNAPKEIKPEDAIKDVLKGILQ